MTAAAAPMTTGLFGCRRSEAEPIPGPADETPRAVKGVFSPGPEHWVGDGFLVKSVFHPQDDPELCLAIQADFRQRARVFTPCEGPNQLD